MRYQIVRRGGEAGVQVGSFSVEGAGTEWVSFGKPFAVGDIGPGQTLIAETLAGVPVNTQATVAATWDDGSACHVYVSAQVTGGQSYRLFTAAPSGSVLTVADLLAAVPGDIVRLEATAGLTATVSLRDLLESSSNRARLNNTSNYVLLSQGQHTLELLAAQNLDTHERAEIHLRWYGGTLLWMDVAFYNGYANLNGMTSRAFTVTMFLNGVQKEVRSVTHFNRTEWHRPYWSSGGTLYVRHVAAELTGSGVVANYDLSEAPSESLLSSVLQSVNPLEIGDLEANLGGTGAHTWLGLDTRWGSSYLTSNCERRAHNWNLANTDAAMAYQFSSLMDSATGEMLSISDRPTYGAQPANVVNLGSGYTSGLSPNGNSSTGQPASHAMAAGFLAYVVTGQISYLKSLHGWACYETFWTDSNRNHTYNGATIRKGYYGSIRGAGWQYRTVGQAARITPDWHYLKTYFKNTVNGNLIRDYSDFSTFSSIGAVDGSEPITQYRTFMHYHLTSSVCYVVLDLGFPLGLPYAQYLSILVAGLMGNTGQYNWCCATAQDRAIAATDAGPIYTTFAQLNADTRNVPSYAQALVPGSQACATALFNNGETVSSLPGTMTGHPESSTGYPSNIRPCVSYLAALGITGAAQCWTNLNQGLQADYQDMPMFNVAPR